MNQLKAFFLFFILLSLMFSFSQPIYSNQKPKIRIIKSGAVLRLQPSESSQIIKELNLGAEFIFIEKIGKWMKIQLPPDRNNIVISGYVKQFFLEFVFSPKAEFIPTEIPEKVDIQPTKETTPPTISERSDEQYFQWKKELESARSRLRTGNSLSTIGTITSLLGGILYWVDQEETTEYDIWGFSYTIKKKKAPYLISAGGGLLMSILGFAISGPAKDELRMLEMEGARKGYMYTSIVFLKKGCAFQINYTF